MKKVGIIVVTVLLIIVGSMVIPYLSNGDGNTRVTNDKAQKDKKERYLTIINDTGEIINEVRITVGEGTEINSAFQENPDEQSFSIKIPREYKEYSEFTVILIDRYGMRFQKKVEDVPKKGRTEVKITEDDYVEQDGDWKRGWDKFFNGD